MHRLAALILVALSVTGCGETEKTVSLKLQPDLQPADVAAAEQAARALFDACPGIGRHWGDLTAPQGVTIRPASLTEQRDRGWKRAAAVELVVSERPQSLPGTYRAAGQHCHFEIGIELPLGVAVAKAACVSVCLDRAATEISTFIPAGR